MELELKEITLREVFKGYVNNNEEGVLGYGGKLNIRPKYQREFIYKDKRRNAVIETIRKGFPLNVMYWAKSEDGTYELMDGQQRTLSACMYINGDYSLEYQFFHNLTKPEQEQILDYKIMVYFCEGDDKEKLDWFRTINIAGEKFTDQEIRNAVYAGPWMTDAKRHFSKTSCPAYNLAKDYMKGAPIRQDYLETALNWISNEEIEDYMSKSQHKTNANELWLYFQSVINWVQAVFPKYRKEMKGIEWGSLYNELKDKSFDPNELEKRVTELMKNDEITKKQGIYTYVLTGEERHLSIRKFTENQKREAYEIQEGICKKCGQHFDIKETEADHIKPWHEGGRTIAENCQILCKQCNRTKSGI